MDCSPPTRLLCPWDSPGKNSGVGCHCLFQGIFLTQGSILHCRQTVYQLSHQGSPRNSLPGLYFLSNRSNWGAVVCFYPTYYNHCCDLMVICILANLAATVWMSAWLPRLVCWSSNAPCLLCSRFLSELTESQSRSSRCKNTVAILIFPFPYMYIILLDNNKIN